VSPCVQAADDTDPSASSVYDRIASRYDACIDSEEAALW
jgi:hypothetical protein